MSIETMKAMFQSKSIQRRRMQTVICILLIGIAMLPLTPARAAAWDVVASGLDNPRGLAFSPDGALYVAEAGRGGAGPCIPSPEGGVACIGASGAVTRIADGVQKRIATGLSSLANPEGGFAIGPVDISFQGSAYVIVGLGADPTKRADLGPLGAGLGQLVHLPASGQWRNIVDVAAYESSHNPDGGALDSNPYALLATTGKRIVADAGANAVLEVAANGAIATLAVFPEASVPGNPAMQAVPNAITQGPDGAYYVGQLTGVPFPAGGANVYRLVPGSTPQVYASGFTTIIDLAFGADGSLYVLEIFPGDLIRVALDGSRTTVASGLTLPGGLAVGPDGALYVSNFGAFAGAGQVVRITP